MREVPKAFEKYRHFKGNVYQILNLAKDSETMEDVVVYQALYGDCQIYVRPLAMFMSEVDKDKYPDAEAKFRFEKVETEPKKKTSSKPEEVRETQQSEEKTETNSGIDPAVLEFLDADTYGQKLNILASLKHRITDDMITTMALVYDLEVEEGPVEVRYEQLRNCLLTKEKYECVRVR